MVLRSKRGLMSMNKEQANGYREIKLGERERERGRRGRALAVAVVPGAVGGRWGGSGADPSKESGATGQRR